MSKSKKKFRVEYTSTAFEQDSGLAMKGSVVRALIELITNCDDAYSRARKSGPIMVEVHRFPGSDTSTRIAVRDAATGLDRGGMEKNFIQLGGDRSGFAEGEEVRGLFSRGSKDTAWFGETVFESIKNGEYTQLTLFADGTGEVESRSASPAEYQGLALSEGENGLSATMVVRRENTRVPDLRELCDRLAAHVQLRGITLRQEVTITEYRNGKKTPKAPVVWDPPFATTILDEEIEIPGFDCRARLTIERMAQRSEGPVSDVSIHGIEVHGTRAVYENTDFSQNASGMALLRGRVVCPKIDDLVRSYDPRGSSDELNPMRLVTRSRDGLEPTHPFTQALATAVVQHLKPILDELEPKTQEGGSEKLKRDLSRLGKLLAEEMRSDLEEEADETGSGARPTPTNPIVLIPPQLSAQLSSTRTITALILKGSPAAKGLQASVDSERAVIISQPEQMVDHARLADTLVAQVRVEMKTIGLCQLTVAAVQDPMIAGSSQITIHDLPDSEVPPLDLEWKNTSMSVSVGKTRSVQLRAPVELGSTGELAVTVLINGEGVTLEESDTILKLTGKGWLVGKVHVTGVAHSESPCQITALGGGAQAEGQIRATVSLPTGGLNIHPRIVDDFKGPFRGEIKRTDAAITLDMFARHKGLSRYLGARKKDGSYTRENEPETKAVLAEVMASVATDHVIRRQAERDPSRFASLDLALFQRTQILDRYLRILLEGLRQGEAD